MGNVLGDRPNADNKAMIVKMLQAAKQHKVLCEIYTPLYKIGMRPWECEDVFTLC